MELQVPLAVAVADSFPDGQSHRQVDCSWLLLLLQQANVAQIKIKR